MFSINLNLLNRQMRRVVEYSWVIDLCHPVLKERAESGIVPVLRCSFCFHERRRQLQPYATIIGVIELRESGLPYTACQERFGIGSSTVHLIMQRFEESELNLSDLKQLPEERVTELIYPPDLRRNPDMLLPDFESMCVRMEERGSRLNMAALWWEYSRLDPEHTYKYTQFAKLLGAYVKKTRGPQHLKMLVERIPGERMYVDWVGDQPALLLDPDTGELRRAHVFCATLGVSSLGYTEIFPDEKLPSFIQGVVHALEYFGALPSFIVCDNLKAAVTKNSRDNLILTTACLDLQDFYDIVFLPPPPLKPTGKGSVESYVRFVETHYIEALKAAAASEPFTSVEAANKKGFELCDELNTRLERGRVYTRRDIFQNVDLPQMRPLPAESFTMWDYVRYEKVPNTYHVTYDKHLYSVPYACAGAPAVVKASMSEVIVTDAKNRLVARHRRSYNEYPKKITDPSHLHPDHKFYADVNAMDGNVYREWAAGIGVHTAEMMEALLKTTSREEQMYSRCAAVISDVKDAAGAAIEAAAEVCLQSGTISCTGFRQAVADQMKEHACAKRTDVQKPHCNMRGKDYYV